MNLNNIGNYIAEKRTEKNLSQAALAEQLNTTETLVVKWENGKAFPASKYVMPLCEVLGVSVNELLAGSNLEGEEYKDVAEDNLLEYVEMKGKNKLSNLLSLATIGSSLVSAILIIFILGFATIPTALKVISIIVCILVLGVSITALVMNHNDDYTRYFVCPDCKTKFVPDIKTRMSAKSTFTSKELECPNCGKTNYCKQRYNVLVKNEKEEENTEE